MDVRKVKPNPPHNPRNRPYCRNGCAPIGGGTLVTAAAMFQSLCEPVFLEGAAPSTDVYASRVACMLATAYDWVEVIGSNGGVYPVIVYHEPQASGGWRSCMCAHDYVSDSWVDFSSVAKNGYLAPSDRTQTHRFQRSSSFSDGTFDLRFSSGREAFFSLITAKYAYMNMGLS